MAERMVLIYSGGLDSTVLLYHLHSIDNDVLCVNFSYGSKHNHRERECAEMNCKRLGVQLIKIDLPFVNECFQSSLLTSGGDIPEGHYAAENMKSTVVPFRNGIMLSIAAGIAESAGIKAIAIAAHSGDHYIYPDCRPHFLNCFDAAIFAGTESQVRLFTPFCDISKIGIVALGTKLDVPFGYTWTCYKGGETHCGVCGSCNERKEAFEQANVLDPTFYAQ